MATVYVRNKDIETAIRLFTEKCKKEQIIKECNSRIYFKAKGDKRRDAKAAAVKRSQRRKA